MTLAELHGSVSDGEFVLRVILFTVGFGLLYFWHRQRRRDAVRRDAEAARARRQAAGAGEIRKPD